MKVLKTLSIGAVVIAVAASAAAAAGLTERLQSERMTVLKVDRAAGRFQCVEHLSWTAVEKSSLAIVHTGDVVRVDKSAGATARLVLVRTAADELSSPE